MAVKLSFRTGLRCEHTLRSPVAPSRHSTKLNLFVLVFTNRGSLAKHIGLMGNYNSASCSNIAFYLPDTFPNYTAEINAGDL